MYISHTPRTSLYSVYKILLVFHVHFLTLCVKIQQCAFLFVQKFDAHGKKLALIAPYLSIHVHVYANTNLHALTIFYGIVLMVSTQNMKNIVKNILDSSMTLVQFHMFILTAPIKTNGGTNWPKQ